MVPGPDGLPVQATEVGFRSSRQHWNQYLLDDGSVVRMKFVATPALRVDDMKGTAAAVYSPHQDLSGSVAQLHTQMASVPQSLASRVAPDLALDPWNDPRGAVITGRISELDKEQLDSFLCHRVGLTKGTVLGYDEVLHRLTALRTMLSSVPKFDGDEADPEALVRIEPKVDPWLDGPLES